MKKQWDIHYQYNAIRFAAVYIRVKRHEDKHISLISNTILSYFGIDDSFPVTYHFLIFQP